MVIAVPAAKHCANVNVSSKTVNLYKKKHSNLHAGTWPLDPHDVNERQDQLGEEEVDDRYYFTIDQLHSFKLKPQFVGMH
jgi:hypothetical protein